MGHSLLIYALIDPRTDLIRYVGLSCKGLQRAKTHGMPSTLKEEPIAHKTHWIKQLLQRGLRYRIHVLEICQTDQQLSDAEIWWIAYGTISGWPLTNYHPGGMLRSWTVHHPVQVVHGSQTAYNKYGCRCAPCRMGASARFAAKMAARPRAEKIEYYKHPIQIPHGAFNSYNKLGCRCDPCRKSNHDRFQAKKNPGTKR